MIIFFFHSKMWKVSVCRSICRFGIQLTRKVIFSLCSNPRFFSSVPHFLSKAAWHAWSCIQNQSSLPDFLNIYTRSGEPILSNSLINDISRALFMGNKTWSPSNNWIETRERVARESLVKANIISVLVSLVKRAHHSFSVSSSFLEMGHHSIYCEWLIFQGVHNSSIGPPKTNDSVSLA